MSLTKSFDEIRDACTMPNNIDVIKQYINNFKKNYSMCNDKSVEIKNFRIEDLIGVAVYYHNSVAMPMFRWLLLEYPFNIKVEDVIKAIYWAECHYTGKISTDFSEVRNKYIKQYSYPLKVHLGLNI